MIRDDELETMRDIMATAALIGMGTWTPTDGPGDGINRRARYAYAQADAMLEARKVKAATG